MKRFLQNDRGFTLVELMVVVAIIGILSAVAIPNFKKYQAKSKTSEAKLGLSALYSSETALYSDYSSYATCLDYAGFSPNPDYYAIGFNAGNSTANGNVATNGGTGCNTSDGNQFVWEAEKMIENTKVETIADSAATVPDGGGEFIAQAEGRISEGGESGDNDIWQINQDKELKHNQAGY